MSGSAACNGCGYLGMTHGTELMNFVAIIGPDVIIKFMLDSRNRLHSLGSYPKLEKILEVQWIKMIPKLKLSFHYWY
jgi:hypothetical protein